MVVVAKKQAGISIIELLVSITIGLLIISGVVQLYSATRGNALLSSEQSTIQDGFRYFISQLEIDAAQAGALGCFSQAFRKNERYIGDILTKENEDATPGDNLSRYNVSRLIDGSNDTGLLESDTILFRYASTYAGIPVDTYLRESSTSNTITLDLSTQAAKEHYKDIDQYDVLLAADCSGAIYFMVTNNPTDTPGDKEILEFKAGVVASSGHENAGQENRLVSGFSITKLEDENDASDYEDDVIVGDWKSDAGHAASTRPHVYSSSSSRAVIYSIGDSEMGKDLGRTCTKNTPEYCALKRGDVELVDGVEDFQVEYGWHVNDEDGVLRFGESTDIPKDQWNNIDRIRVSLSLISPSAPKSGDQIRRSYVRTIALRNQLGE